MAKDAKEDKKDAKGAKAAKGGDRTVVRVWVSRGRAYASLIGFTVTTWVSHSKGMGFVDAAYHGLIGAILFSFVGWLCALLVLTGLMRTAARNVTTPMVRPGPPPRAKVGAPEALPPGSAEAG